MIKPDKMYNNKFKIFFIPSAFSHGFNFFLIKVKLHKFYDKIIKTEREQQIHKFLVSISDSYNLQDVYLRSRVSGHETNRRKTVFRFVVTEFGSNT